MTKQIIRKCAFMGALLSFLPTASLGLSCAEPRFDDEIDAAIASGRQAAIIRGKLSYPVQQPGFSTAGWGVGEERRDRLEFSHRMISAKIQGYIATPEGFSKPIETEVTIKTYCVGWFDEYYCGRDRRGPVAARMDIEETIYILAHEAESYILLNGECIFNSFEADQNSIERVTECFRNGECP